MYQKVEIFILLSFLSVEISAQIQLSGTIVDADTKKPLAFANETLLKADSTFINGALCDSAGFFTFKNLPQGDYLLSSTFTGYDKIYTQVVALDKDRDLGTIALQPSGVMLNEVTVTGAAVIQKPDRKIIIPSATQIRASNSGITLLRNLQLSRIEINPVNNTITTFGGEAVQLRINGIEVTMAEVVALQPQDIIRIEYHDNPSLRYGDVAAVINYITRRRDSGGSLSTDLTNALWRLGFADDYLSAKVNHKKSEFGANVYYHYRDLDWVHENHQTFVFPTMVIQQDEIGNPTKFNEKSLNLALNYNLNQPDKYLFNVTFRNNYYDTPNPNSDRISTLYSSNDTVPASISDHSTWWNNSPSLDVYFQRNLKHDQLLIFNAVGTYMDSKSTRLYQQTQADEDPYVSYSCITGNKYSLIAEGIYEKKFKDGTLTGGMKHTQSYTENDYTGNVSSHVALTVAETWGHLEYQFQKKKFNYMFGLGVKRTFDSQDENRMEKYIFCPKMSVVYTINNNTYIRYTGYVSGYPPSLSDLNNVTQNIDALQIQQGNPNLRPVWFVANNFNAEYNKGMFGLEFFAQYFYQHQPVMEQIIFSDSVFIHTNFNQQAYHHLYSELTLKLRPWKNYVTLSVTPSFDRYICIGNEYLHTYNNWRIRGSLMVTCNNWIFMAEDYTRRNNFWSETLSLGDPSVLMLTAGYNTQKWGLGVMVANPFTDTWTSGSVNYSALAPYTSSIYTHNLGQVIAFRFRLNLNYGRKYNAADKRLDNKDTDAGIMTGTKK